MPRLCSNPEHVKRYFDGRCIDCAAKDNRVAYAKRKAARRSGLSPERAKVAQDVLDSLGHSDGKPSPAKVYSFPDAWANLLDDESPLVGITARHVRQPELEASR